MVDEFVQKNRAPHAQQHYRVDGIQASHINGLAASPPRSRHAGFRRMSTKMPSMAHLFGMSPEDLAAHLRANGVTIRDAEARRIVAHAIAHGRDGHPTSRPVPRSVEAAVDA